MCVILSKSLKLKTDSADSSSEKDLKKIKKSLDMKSELSYYIKAD